MKVKNNLKDSRIFLRNKKSQINFPAAIFTENSHQKIFITQLVNRNSHQEGKNFYHWRQLVGN